jgi:bifunctional non-homologous end joining protein LigD
LNKARFIEPMLLLRKEHLPEGREWQYELKLDGYRAIAFKANGKLHLRSRNNNDFLARYPAVGQALEALRDNTVIDGEIVAFDEAGRPSFNTLQNHGSSGVPLVFFVFDLLILSGRDWRRGRPS